MAETKSKKTIRRVNISNNTLLNNPNISIPGYSNVPSVGKINLKSNDSKRNDQSLYKKAIEVGLKNKTMETKIKNGKVFYEIKEPIIFQNYGHKIRGKFVLTRIDEKYRLFIVRPEKKAVSVPFGEFNNLAKESPFDYIIENREIGSNVFIHNHLRSDEVSSYMTKEEMKKLTEYYAFKPNSQKVGEAILDYLKEEKQTLEQVSDMWSGSGLNRYNFGTEIEAHADMLLDKTKFTNFLKEIRKFSKNGFKESEKFEKDYYNALGMADMARSDKGKPDKVLMDAIWGLPDDKEKENLKKLRELQLLNHR